MALSLPGERSGTAQHAARPFTTALRWLGQMNAARLRRAALSDLLELDSGRLSDLGISREDVLVALAAPANGGHVLNAARARNARPVHS